MRQWQYGRRGQDGWAKWTRRRKWYRDAELVEVDELDLPLPGENGTPESPKNSHKKSYSTSGEKMVPVRAETHHLASDQPGTDDDGASILSTSSKSSFWPSSFRRRATEKPGTSTEKDQSRSVTEPAPDDDTSGLDLETELELQKQGKDGGRWGIGDEARMNLE